MTLVEFLSKLNSADNQQGIFVDPSDWDDFVICDKKYAPAGRVLIGSLDNLSFGFQSEYEAFACWVSGGEDPRRIWSVTETVTDHRGREIRVNPQALYEAWTEGRISQEFSDFIQDQVWEISKVWAKLEAQHFVKVELPQIIEEAMPQVLSA